MTERTITFTGTVSLEEAKRLIAEAEGARVEEGRLYWLPSSRNAKRIRYRKTAGHWVISGDGGATWCSTHCSYDDCVYPTNLVPYEPEPFPVVYRHVETTEDGPHNKGYALFRYVDDDWHVLAVGSSEWRDFPVSHPELLDDIRYGRRIPYLGYQEPPRFTVGQWVMHKTQPWAKARQVFGITGDWYVTDGNEPRESYPLRNLRPATDAEITEAKRIEVKPELIVRGKESGAVMQFVRGRAVVLWHPDWPLGTVADLRHPITTEHYDILPNYLVEGAK